MLDQFGQDFAGALVRFGVQGANARPTTSSQITNSTGKVAFQDQGGNLGIDTIVAYVDLHNDFTLDPGDPYDTGSVVWLRQPGQGYWLAASDGEVFAFGDAAFRGSTGAMHLNKPVIGIGAMPDGSGYTMAASDGGVFNFGGAPAFGSAAGGPLNKPVVGMALAP